MYFPESKLAHRYIDPLQPGPGLELGGSAHNTWNIPNTINVDYTDDMTTVFKREEVKLCGQALPVDVVAEASDLPFTDSSYHWVLNSHIFEHCASPICTLLEWHRVLVPGGIIFTHIPKRDAHPPDRERPISTLGELVRAHVERYTVDTHPIREKYCHYYVWDIPLYVNMIGWINREPRFWTGPFRGRFDLLNLLETDDKVGNSHAFVLRVVK